MDRKSDIDWDGLSPVGRSNSKRNFASQDLYRAKFAEAEAKMRDEGTPLAVSVANILESNASRTYFMMERHEVDGPEADETYLKAAIRMAFGYTNEEVELYLIRTVAELNEPDER